ncbi:MAG TPA: hypothetical protein VMB84_17110 [Stellaceae bacterium]|nr:hypothetical protein [Stellaceae bacterium]
MANPQSDPGPAMLPRLATAIALVAIVCPALRVPLVLGCLGALGYAALSRNEISLSGQEAAEAPGAGAARRESRPRLREVATDTEDSFPASDPPSFTPVTGTRTRH